MRRSTVYCFWMLLFLMIADGAATPQSDSINYKPIFENGDFAIFRIENAEKLASVTRETKFGLLLLRASPNEWDMSSCSFCFAGPTGHWSRLVFGTAGYVADRYSEVNETPVWVGIKSNGNIDQALFDKDQPQEFKGSVRADLVSIGILANIVEFGGRPDERDLRRAAAGLDDLSIKSGFFALFERGHAPPPLITVTVHTVSVKSGKETSKWIVWYVTEGWEGDEDQTYRFDNESSPTQQVLPPGRYKMWASRKGSQGAKQTVLVGDTKSLTKELQVEIP